MTVIHRVTAIYRAVIYRFDCIPLFVDFVNYLTFWHNMIQIKILMHKSVDYFVCCICHYGLDQA